MDLDLWPIGLRPLLVAIAFLVTSAALAVSSLVLTTVRLLPKRQKVGR